MDIPFMVPYWATFGVLAVLTAVTWITWSVSNYDGAFTPRIRRNLLRGAFVLSGVAVLMALAGFWLPFLIPGLY